MPKPAIALFARAPIPGRVKTRLIATLGAQAACDLHRALAGDAWTALQQFRGACGLFLYADSAHPEWEALAGSRRLRLQQGSSLGERMLTCLEGMRASGFERLLIVGSDTAGLTAAHIAPWVDLLAGAQAVLGPAEDGGYWAVGCRAPHPRMFEGVRWSSARTFHLTLAAFERLGWTTAMLARLRDVDTPADLRGLGSRPGLGLRTQRWLDEFAAGGFQSEPRNSTKRRA